MSGMIVHLDEFDEGESLRRVAVEVDAPQATALLDDPTYSATSPLTGELTVNLVGTTLRVFGPLRLDVSFECGRCLEQRERHVEIDAEFVLMERSSWASTYEDEAPDEVELELDPEDMDVSIYEGDDVDLGPLVREAILVELPTLPRCSEEDREACDEAYRRNVGDAALQDLEEASLDHRWAALKNIKLKE